MLSEVEEVKSSQVFHISNVDMQPTTMMTPERIEKDESKVARMVAEITKTYA
jgi:hypothetical protein